MLTLGADAVRAAFDTEYAEAAGSAAKKLLAALPDERRAAVERLRTHLRVVQSTDQPRVPVLRTLRGAVLDRRVVTFLYHKSGAGPGERRVNPLGLVSLHGVWLLTAFDPAQGAQRNYRLDRMTELRITADTFVPDPAFRLERQPEREQRDVTVRLRFPSEQNHQVRERPNFFQTAEQDTPAGYEVTLSVRRAADILPWVLSWGALAEVLEPAELREQVRQEACALLGRS